MYVRVWLNKVRSVKAITMYLHRIYIIKLKQLEEKVEV
jgi:hypothetical protein